MDARTNVLVINVFLIVAGLWLMITAYAFPYQVGSPTRVIEFWTGVLVIGIALICAVKPSVSSWLSWVNVALGILLILAPFLLGYANRNVALWNEIILGVIIVGLGAWSAREGRGESAALR